MPEGLASTVIPVFNRPAMLREAVDSVLAQSWPHLEIIIVDDGSTDDTPAVMRELEQLHPDKIRLLRQDNAGPGVARQTGLERATGEFVQFLDSDDLLLPRKLELQIEGLRSDPEADIAYGKSYVEEDGVRQQAPAQLTGRRFRTLFPALLAEPLWPTMVPLYRREFLARIGPWPRARQLEDWQYDAQAGALGAKLHYVDEYIAVTRNHTQGRLCHLWQSDAAAMKDRLAAYGRVLECARRAGVEPDSPEMQRFVRSLFWMARTAGAYGLPEEAWNLFDLSRANAIRPGWDYRLVGLAARVCGWRMAGRLSNWAGGLSQ
jgi:glycosyltransferase involved in cell wall biosynthesis